MARFIQRKDMQVLQYISLGLTKEQVALKMDLSIDRVNKLLSSAREYKRRLPELVGGNDPEFIKAHQQLQPRTAAALERAGIPLMRFKGLEPDEITSILVEIPRFGPRAMHDLIRLLPKLVVR